MRTGSSQTNTTAIHQNTQNHLYQPRTTHGGTSTTSHLGRNVQNGGRLHVWPDAAFEHVGANRLGLPLSRGHGHQPAEHLASAVTQPRHERKNAFRLTSALHVRRSSNFLIGMELKTKTTRPVFRAIQPPRDKQHDIHRASTQDTLNEQLHNPRKHHRHKTNECGACSEPATITCFHPHDASTAHIGNATRR